MNVNAFRQEVGADNSLVRRSSSRRPAGRTASRRREAAAAAAASVDRAASPILQGVLSDSSFASDAGHVDVPPLSGFGTLVSGTPTTSPRGNSSRGSTPRGLARGSSASLSASTPAPPPRAVDENSAEGRLRARYIVSNEVVGRGGYGSVVTGKTRSSGSVVAIKQINKKKIGAKGISALMGEVQTLSMLNHAYIVRMEEVVCDDSDLFIVMEYVPKGELGRLLKSHGRFPESTVQRIALQLLLAVDYFHSKGIVHRDMKLANCLVSSVAKRPSVFSPSALASSGMASPLSMPLSLPPSNDDGGGDPVIHVKIADFGFAVMVGDQPCLTTFCGTTTYMAPEVLNRSHSVSYGKPVDMWSLGVMIYCLMCGEHPFHGSSTTKLIEAICAGEFEFRGSAWNRASPVAKDFVSKLLVVDPNRRMLAKDGLSHAWIRGAMDLNDEDDRRRDAIQQQVDLGFSFDESDGNFSPRLSHVASLMASPSFMQQRKALVRRKFRARVLVVMGVHRLLYVLRVEHLRRCHADIPILRSFSFLVARHFEPAAQGHMIAAPPTYFNGNVKALHQLTDMLEVSQTAETFDVSSNSIDNLELVQKIVRVTSMHPSLTTLNLENNPIPPLAGRALLRLSRSGIKLKTINVNNTPVAAEYGAQITQNLRELELRRRSDGTYGQPTAAAPTAGGFFSPGNYTAAPASRAAERATSLADRAAAASPTRGTMASAAGSTGARADASPPRRPRGATVAAAGVASDVHGASGRPVAARSMTLAFEQSASPPRRSAASTPGPNLPPIAGGLRRR